MKVLLLAVLLGIAAARSVHDSKHAVDFDDCATQLHAVERDMKTELGKALKDTLDKIVNGFKDRVEKVKGVVGQVTDKVNALKEKLRKLGEEGKKKSQEAIDLVKKSVHDIVDTILDNIHKKKDNLDKQMDEVSKLKAKDLIKRLQERILEKVRGIREYIKDIAVDNEAVRQLKALLAQMNDTELAHILNNILDLSGHEYRHLKDLFQKLKEIGVESKGALKDKISDLTDWVHNLWHEGLEEMVDKFHDVKASLLEVISSTKDFSVEAVRDALKHLESYKEHLGGLYEKLVDSLKKAIGKF